MYIHETSLRVRYGETDKMGFVYYGVYAQYYEVGRVELLRYLCLSYKSLEESGYELPIVSFNINYKNPAFYDDQIIIKTTISNISFSKIIFECFNTKDALLNNGKVVVVFVNKTTKKPCKAAEILLEKIRRAL